MIKKLKIYFTKEPAVIIGAVAAFIIVVVESLPYFFPAIDTEQVNALLRIVQSGVAVVSVLFIRSQVYAPATVEALTQAAASDGN